MRASTPQPLDYERSPCYTTPVVTPVNLMDDQPTLGDLEIEVLRFVSNRAPISIRDTAETFGRERGLARTTILTVMERLRKKKYLARRRVEGVFLYQSSVSP